MNNRLRIVRGGVPHYVAPWVSELSPAARSMIGTGPSKHDPQGQLGLPIPNPDCDQLTFLDFAPKSKKPIVTVKDTASDMAKALEALLEWGREHTSPRDANSPHDLLVAAAAALAAYEGGK